MRLDDAVAIVTGASSGIGAALARALAARGARLVLAARRRERLAEVAASCRAADGSALGGLRAPLLCPADVTRHEDRRALVAAALARFGRLDLLFNNAGVGAYGPLQETSEHELRRVFEVNVLAPMLLARAVLPVMLEQRSGLVVNVASIGGLLAHGEGLTAYVASKHALVGFSRALARDLAGTGVRVLAPCPHLTDTELFAASAGAGEMAGVVERYRSFMDSAEAVAEGIVRDLEADRVVVFPTDKPARAYERGREL